MNAVVVVIVVVFEILNYHFLFAITLVNLAKLAINNLNKKERIFFSSSNRYRYNYIIILITKEKRANKEKKSSDTT